MENILVCDDDREIVDAIEIYLEQEGFHVYKAYDGEEGLSVLRKNQIHLAIVDIMMPKLDGIHLVKELRGFSTIPVIFLSAKSEDSDKILGLNIGADDYVTKPFNPLELVARVKSNVRRYTTLGKIVEKDNVYTSGGLVVDDNAKTVTVYGESIRLTPIEYKILAFLAKNKGKVYSIDQIYENIWGDISVRTDNTIAVHIRHIREKIEVDPREPKFLKVVWGVGYKIEEDAK
ncbi:MAG: response regulator transcription factor [Butyrivibrio sp.]|jgi:DNA-binding response OmpR family regulator|uniref:response regulator transcription factor n=1 Tax=Butyrivibrio sp. TaxID=28121 RepID=UPI001B189A5C|nr:response regulator transcription factor [Butyrivibrio sp.]MBO5622795.1 response regulator transcription factor [Butyrivibrio sp.]MBP3273795.1 response regulator transcription factor [Butyrivibrio sp.]MBP3782774.1 response regulator transcription factor [Butyrivibrio sp.]